MKRLLFHLLVLGAIGVTVLSALHHDANGQSPSSAVGRTNVTTKRPTVILGLIDRSDSMNHHVPPETTLPLSLHLVDLATLSPEEVRVSFIFFGGDVTTLGDEKGLPTAAHDTLRKKLLTAWPRGSGKTPMDEAFLKALQIVKQLPPDTDITIVLLTDGEPESGRLRPKDFPDIKREIDTARKFVLERHRSFTPLIQQEKLAELERELVDPTSDRAKKLLETQRSLEFAKTKEYAVALKNHSVRFVTIDLVNNPALVDLHAAAGGKPEDLVVTNPNNVIAPLHKLRITALPRVVQLPNRPMDAAPQTTTHDFEVSFDNIADAAVVTIEFHPALADFDNNYSLTAEMDGTTFTFATARDLSAASLATDRAGNVASATLTVAAPPPNAKVRFHWSSSGGQKVPAATIYTFLRLKESMVAQFRPKFARVDARPPFVVSALRAGEFEGGLKADEKGERIAVQGMEAILRGQRNGQQIRLALHPDPKMPGNFLTAPTSLVDGRYDVEVHYVLTSGAMFRLVLTNHVQSVNKSELISLDLPQPGSNATDTASLVRSHLGYGMLGDVVTTRTIKIRLRSMDLDHPVVVRPSVEIADRDHNVPNRSWLRCTPTTVSLPPGKPVDVQITLEIPPDVEPAIQDGPFEGRIVLTDEETKLPFTINRFQPLSGVSTTELVEKVSFELKRPRFTPKICRAFHNWIHVGGDGRVYAKVLNSIADPFSRFIDLEVSHDSEIAREIQLLSSGRVLDPLGSHIPSIRIVPHATTEMNQKIPPGGKAVFRLWFEVDADCSAPRGTVDLDLFAPGVVPQHITLETERRQPLLEQSLRRSLFGLAAGCAFLCGLWLLRWRQARRFRTGVEYEITSQRPMAGVLSVVDSRQGVAIRTEEGVQLKTAKDSRFYSRGSRPIALSSQDTQSKPLQIRLGPTEDAAVFDVEELPLVPGDPAILRVTVRDGGRYDDAADRSWGKLRNWILATALLLAVCIGLRQLVILRAVQWLYDLIASRV